MILLRDINRNDVKISVAYVLQEQARGSLTPESMTTLMRLQDDPWKEFLPALQKAEAGSNKSTSGMASWAKRALRGRER